jgi:uncharacterized membrane protein YciS (DUF1049 family)
MVEVGGLDRPQTIFSARTGVAMRLFYFLLLVAFVVAVTVLVIQNRQDVTLRFYDRSETFSLPVVIGVIYVLGMFTGWTVVGLLKRSVQRITDRQN